MKRFTQCLVLTLALFGLPQFAEANDYTDVIDAFDMEYNDPFDINIAVGYQRTFTTGVIRREVFENAQPHDWDYYDYLNYFRFQHTRHILNFQLDIGIYKDIAIRFRLPLILNDTRELRAHKDWKGIWPDTNGNGSPNEPGDALFSTPFKSPDRSGVDFFAAGLWWGILDQGRDDTKPNWTIYAEGRFGVGETIRPSCVPGQELPSSQYANLTCDDQRIRDRMSDKDFANRGGISRGINEVVFGTRLSRRYGFMDPYFGINAMIGWAKDGTSFFIDNNKASQLNTMPPVVGELDFGIEFIPWEIEEKHIKMTINLGGLAKYHSEGRDYTPLFDALGTSPYFKLHAPDYDFDGNGDVELDRQTAMNEWSGMTDVENYATFGGRLIVGMQPAKYVKFHLGVELDHETEHFITKTDQCSAGNLVSVPGQGTECSSPNAGHRPEIDTPGTRFRAEETFLWHFFLDAIAQF